MKRFILAALLSASVAPAAFAMTDSQLLSNADRAEIMRVVPAADLSDLTNAQAGALAAALNSDGRDGNIAGQIRAIVTSTQSANVSRVADIADLTFPASGNTAGSDR